MKLDIKGLYVEDLTERWSSQLAQIDCRLDTCTFYNGSGECTNPSPAITLNPSGKFTCWSKNEVEEYVCKHCEELVEPPMWNEDKMMLVCFECGERWDDE